jgi:PTH1 family peptidyl-tRNA hydrolase
MKLIVGLGNPEEKYDFTRHNLGFWVINLLGDELKFKSDHNFKAEIVTKSIRNEDAILVKPQTYMNNSGEAVSKLKNYRKIDDADICVIHDDVDLAIGTVKISFGGSSAGHKGVQSIMNQLGTDQFWRVRIGAGRSDKIPTEDWVLMKYTDNERTQFLNIVKEVVDYLRTKDLTQTTFSIDIKL